MVIISMQPSPYESYILEELDSIRKSHRRLRLFLVLETLLLILILFLLFIPEGQKTRISNQGAGHIQTLQQYLNKIIQGEPTHKKKQAEAPLPPFELPRYYGVSIGYTPDSSSPTGQRITHIAYDEIPQKSPPAKAEIRKALRPDE